MQYDEMRHDGAMTFKDVERERRLALVEALKGIQHMLKHGVTDDDLENLDENIRLLAMKDEDWNS